MGPHDPKISSEKKESSNSKCSASETDTKRAKQDGLGKENSSCKIPENGSRKILYLHIRSQLAYNMNAAFQDVDKTHSGAQPGTLKKGNFCGPLKCPMTYHGIAAAEHLR
ncbi:unnamed protein product [Dovyalis caffra]|uniref:Uncharacterized protein n=1 Tax=Dovyalis caffra TaxID=77055 RepID=A0AAV1SWR5_9ROSI|nr:unnamed protein product [Dovyalis caffra]